MNQCYKKKVDVSYIRWIAILLCVTFGMPLQAAEQNAGPYTVHYNAFNSTFILAEVAKAAQLPRNGKTGLLNIAVQKTDGALPEALEATFKGRVENLLGQAQHLTFVLIQEPDAIYYIAPFTFENEDKLRFYIDVIPAGQKRAISVKFHQTFYRD